MRLLVLPKYDIEGASSRYRHYKYLEYFENNNISYVVKPLLRDGYIKKMYAKKRFSMLGLQLEGIIKRILLLLFNANNYDLILIEKELLPNVPYIVEKYLLRGKAYSLDFDDYIAASYKQSKTKRWFLNNKIDKLVNNAAFVTVGNRWYFEEFKSDNLIYLPTVVDLNDYSVTKSQIHNEKVTIVWIGSLTTAQYLYLIAPELKTLSKKYNIELKVIGAEIEIEGVDVRCVPWSSDTEVLEILGSDIGIMPLTDDLWSRGKCGFKLIQYMACGLPVVASSLPANYEIVDHENCGYIAESNQDWLIYLEKLILNKEVREEFGQKSRTRIVSSYSYQKWGNIYANLILNAKS